MMSEKEQREVIEKKQEIILEIKKLEEKQKALQNLIDAKSIERAKEHLKIPGVAGMVHALWTVANRPDRAGSISGIDASILLERFGGETFCSWYELERQKDRDKKNKKLHKEQLNKGTAVFEKLIDTCTQKENWKVSTPIVVDVEVSVQADSKKQAVENAKKLNLQIKDGDIVLSKNKASSLPAEVRISMQAGTNVDIQWDSFCSAREVE